MPDIRITDPLGRVLVLHDHTWFGHILPRHPEVRLHRRLVERAVSDPLEIRFSAADARCRIYFGAGPRPAIMIAVVADVSGGFVKTAHLVKTPKGAVEWSKPTP